MGGHKEGNRLPANQEETSHQGTESAGILISEP
jgi:hypothetical protein